MMIYKIDPRIQKYIDQIENDDITACKEQQQLVELVKRAFDKGDIYTDFEQLTRYLGLAKYFPYDEVFSWQEFLMGLHLCTFYQKSKRPRWPKLLMLVGRGAGKDGFIAMESFAVTSPYSKISQYDVDICANVEEQAMRPVNDIIGVLETPENEQKLLKYYHHTKEMITGKKTGAVIKGRTNNPKGRDGMRSGMIVFNEIHQYQNYANIKVFKSGLGKKKHPRQLFATSDGDVRDGPLDDMKKEALEILSGEVDDNGMLPFICRLDHKDEVHDQNMWQKANPSLPYLPDLMITIQDEYQDWLRDPVANADLMTKRMNLPQTDVELAITDWENITATNKPIPDMVGHKCNAGLDYASISDWASLNLHFLVGDKRIDISHSWLCLRSKDLFRIKAPWREWAELGLITVVDDVEIPPELIANYIAEVGQKYQILNLALDNFRYTLLARALEKVGFSKDLGNLTLVRPSDIMKIHPVIASCFNNQLYTWGDTPPLRWAANNTKSVKSARATGVDTGNSYYAKIEPKSRKNDPFMALVASQINEDRLREPEQTFDDLPVIVG